MVHQKINLAISAKHCMHAPFPHNVALQRSLEIAWWRVVFQSGGQQKLTVGVNEFISKHQGSKMELDWLFLIIFWQSQGRTQKY